MSDVALLERAAALGLATLTDPATPVDPAAARLLPDSTAGLAIAVGGDVAYIVLDHIPSPAEFSELEAAAGMLVTVAIAPPAVLAALRASARTVTAGAAVAPRSIGPALEAAVAAGSSDVHLAVGTPPFLRTAGRLNPLPNWPALSAADLTEAANWVAGDKLGSFTGDFDCAVSYAGARWRVSLYRQRGGLALALRQIPTVIPRLEDLSLPASVASLADLRSGLVLFCGPTGSGKSTTMAGLIDRINRTRDCHILTIEDPVEFTHRNRRAIVHQREVGADTVDFPTALRGAMRQDPDVIMLGEMRDNETVSIALSAAETGHLVFGTIHARHTAGVFDRVIDSFPADQQNQVRSQLASTLAGVVCQRLLPSTVAGKRQLVSEVLLMNAATSNMVREGKLHELTTVLDAGVSLGMTSFDRSLAQYVAAGRLTEEVARAEVVDTKSFAEHLARMPRTVTALLASLDDLDGMGI